MNLQLILKGLTQNELVLFYLLCVTSYKNDSRDASIVLSDFTIEMVGDKNQWMNLAMEMMNHLLGIRGYEELGNSGRQYFCFFEKYRYVPAEKKIYYTISEYGFQYLPIFCRSVKKEDLLKIANLKGKYVSRLAQLLLPYKIAGFHEIPMNELFDLLEIPDTYETRDLSRKVIQPALDQINKVGLLQNLRFRYYRPFRAPAESLILEWDTKETAISIKKQEKSTSTSKLMDENFNSLYDY